MKLLNAKSVKIGEQEYPIKMSIRAMIEFEATSGHSISKIESLKDITILFYSAVKAGGLDIDYPKFMDLLDDNPEAITAFSEVMADPEGKKQTDQ